jgi:hypothetical protein
MHDCGHHSLFKAKASNRVAAFLLSIIHAMPHHPWSRGHAFHHKHNGNWNRYRGPSSLTTLREYEHKSKHSQFAYKILRHPLTLLPGGFYYLVIKPRVALLLGFLDLRLSTNTNQAFSTPERRFTTRPPTPFASHLPGGGSEAQSDIGTFGSSTPQS